MLFTARNYVGVLKSPSFDPEADSIYNYTSCCNADETTTKYMIDHKTLTIDPAPSIFSDIIRWIILSKFIMFT